MKFRTLIYLLAFLTLAGCGGGKQGPQVTAFVRSTPTGNTRNIADVPRHADVGPLELQAALMSFADTSNSRIAEAAGVIERIGTPQARLTAARMRVFAISANVEIAAGPYPGVALLDLIVVTSLRRMVWEDFWLPLFGDQALPAMEHFREMEEDIWEAAAKVMTAHQLDELAKMILKWREKHPKQVAINYIRFSDFGELGLKPSMRTLSKPGGLFASVKEAAIVAQDMKVAIDRAFYLMSRMQIVISFQIKLAYLEMMFQPEAEGIINQTERIAGITERYAEIAEKLPKELGAVSNQMVKQVFTELAVNRDEMLDGIFTGLTQWQDTTIRTVMGSVSAEREAAINQTVNALVEQQNELYERIDRLVDKSGSEMEETLNHAFLLGLLLLICFFVCLTLYKVFVARPIDRANRQ